MGKQDLAVNRLLERTEIFADLMNGTIFDGKQILNPQKLKLLSTKSGILYEEKGKRKALERRGDIRMQGDLGTYSIILAEETQSAIHYAMPIRAMLYDALEYTRQIQDLEKEHREKQDLTSREELLSGIRKEDRIKPVLTIIFYFGDGKPWDGNRSLYDMLNIDEATESSKVIQKYLPDYKLNIIQADQMERPEKFQTCLRHIFKMLQYKKDKKQLFQYVHSHKEELKKMDGVETMAAVTLLGEQKRLMRLLEENEQEEIDMGNALTELIMDGKAEGKAGEVFIIRRKLVQGLAADEIADWTGLDVGYIHKVHELSMRFPEASDTEIAGRYLGIVKE